MLKTQIACILCCCVTSLQSNLLASNIPKTMASLCFSDAAWARKGNKISVETYFGHLLAHFRGVRHAEDDSHDLLHLRIVDPVSASVKRMILNPDFKTVRGMFTSTHSSFRNKLIRASSQTPLFTNVSCLAVQQACSRTSNRSISG